MASQVHHCPTFHWPLYWIGMATDPQQALDISPCVVCVLNPILAWCAESQQRLKTGLICSDCSHSYWQLPDQNKLTFLLIIPIDMLQHLNFLCRLLTNDYDLPASMWCAQSCSVPRAQALPVPSSKGSPSGSNPALPTMGIPIAHCATQYQVSRTLPVSRTVPVPEPSSTNHGMQIMPLSTSDHFSP